MKKTLIVLIISLLTVFSAEAQNLLHFEAPEWDFGPIREIDGKVSHTFTATNRSNKPVVILDIVASCGCTVPKFSRKPIMPGEKTEIDVTFDPAGRPGAVEKQMTVYSAEREAIARLTIRAQVESRPRSVEEMYPTHAGGGFRLSSTLCAFTYIYGGVEMMSGIGYANTSDFPVKLELRPRKESGLLKVTAPTLIAAGERGDINFIYANPAEGTRYGTISDALEVLVDGRSIGTTVVVHGIGVDHPNNITKDSTPKSEMSENIIKFGAVKAGKGVRRQSFRLQNVGNGELIIRAVEHNDGFGCSLRAGMRIAPGGYLDVEATLDPAHFTAGIVTGYLTLITNDPERPMRRLRMTATVEY